MQTKPKMILIITPNKYTFSVVRRILATDEDYGEQLYSGTYLDCQSWISRNRKRFIL